MRSAYIYIFIFAIVILQACNPKTNTQKLLPNPTDTLKYTLVSHTGKFNKSDSLNQINWNCIQFAGNDEALDHALNQFVNSKINESYHPDLKSKDAIETTLEKYSVKETADFDNVENINTWMHDMNVYVNGRYKNILCLCMDNSEYKGGAHGLNQIEYLLFDIDSLRMVQPDQFLDLKNPSFLALAKKAFARQNITDTIIDGGLGEYFWGSDKRKEGEFYFNENVFIKGSDTIGCQYNPYEIASYAAGMPGLSLGIKDITPFIKVK